MTPLRYAAASLRHYWRTSLASALGVAIAVSTLGGSLLVGTSVQASLRALALARLGEVHATVTADSPFTEALGARVGGVPLLALDGALTHQASQRRAHAVQVYGVDDRFWALQPAGGVHGPDRRGAFLSAALAAELGAAPGDTLLIRARAPSAIPAGVLQGRRDEPGRTVRVVVERVLTRESGGEFSPSPRQGDARAVFVPLARLQQDLDLGGQANLLVAGATTGADVARLTDRLARAATIEDRGLRLRPLDDGTLALESTAGYLTDAVAAAALRAVADARGTATPVLTYLATAIRAHGREVPYSLVSALPEGRIVAEVQAEAPAEPAVEELTSAAGSEAPPVWLSAWAAEDLGVTTGAPIELDYFRWEDATGLTRHTARFRLAGTLAMAGLAVDRHLTPEYPGLSTSESMADWDPPFPVSLERIRPQDEAFWREHRTAPKAFLRLHDGQRLWGSRYGQLTALRVAGAEEAALRAALTARVPVSLAGLAATPVRTQALAAAAGTTDFGEYFSYFSAFVVAASLLLTGLFFRLGVEQRTAEVATLAAIGCTPALVARLFLLEGALLTLAGVAAGTAGAVGFTWLMMAALRTIWVGAVGTTALHLAVTPTPLVAGALGGLATGLGCIALTLRGLGRVSVRGLLSGAWHAAHADGRGRRARRWVGVVPAVAALALVLAGARDLVPMAGAFFGSGILLLVAGLAGVAGLLRAADRRFLAPGSLALVRLGLRQAGARPARSLLSVALIASASFLIVAVGAFRLGGTDVDDPRGGTGGYRLVAESARPLMHDPATAAGRAALGLPDALAGAEIARFRLRPGEDASCANLYRPTTPRLLGAPPAFTAQGRFAFSESLAETPEDRANPWRLLDAPAGGDRVVPVIGDATSLAYTFHARVGGDIVIAAPDGQPLTLRVVGALRDSVLQSELVMGEAAFTRWFPREDGYRVFLIGDRSGRMETAALAAAVEGPLADFGFDAVDAEARLAGYHQVENTYLATFQSLGGLGLVLGTLGLGTVLLRNVLERRRELALLRATGFTGAHLVRTVVAESAGLVAAGLSLGLACAGVAIAPAYAERGEGLPLAAIGLLLAAVAAAGVLSTLAAARAVARGDLLPALRGE